MKKALVFCLSAVVLYALSWVAISSITFFSSDVGLRFLQIQELVDHKWSTFAVDYPGRTVDPEMKFVPYYYAYSVVGGEMYFNISPYFPLLVSFLYAVLGTYGLPVMPVFGSLLTAWATWRLVRLSELPYASLAFLATLFATPMLFYAIVLWDHSLGTGLATLAVAGVAVGLSEGKRHAFVLAGISAGLAIGQRPEIYLFAAALGLSLLWVSFVSRNGTVLYSPTPALPGEGAEQGQKIDHLLSTNRLPPPGGLGWGKQGDQPNHPLQSKQWFHPTLLFASGGLGATGLVWLTQYLWVGHPLGMALAPHLLGYGAPTHTLFSTEVALSTKISNLLLHTEPTASGETMATGLVLVGSVLLFGLLWARFVQDRRFTVVAMALITTGYLLFAYGVLKSALIGIIPTFTLLPFALLYVGETHNAHPQQRPIDRLILSTTVLFLLSIMLTWPGYGGLQWGARYLLPIYPLLVYLAWAGYVNCQSSIVNRQSSTGNAPVSQPANLNLLRFGSLPEDGQERVGSESIRWIAAALLLVGLIVQSTSIYRVMVDHPIHSQIRADLLAMPVEIIATNRPFMPSFMTSINNDKAIVYTRTEAHLNQLIATLIERKIDQFGFVLLGGTTLESNRVVKGYQIRKDRFPSKYYEMYIYKIEKL